MTPQELKNSILQLAIQGKLVEQRPEEGTAEELYRQIQEEKQRLIKAGKVKKEKPLPEITEDEKPFGIPTNWIWTRFGELGSYKKGPFGSALTKSIFVAKGNDTVKVYEQKNAIQKNAKLGEYYITKEYFESRMKGFEVFPGDIIVSCAGTIGETYVLPENLEQGIINQALMRMKLFKPIYIPYFLIFFDFVLKTDARSSSKGSAIKNIPSFDILKNYLVPLPPLAEQRRIVSKIENLLPYVEQYEQAWSRLEDFNKHFPDDMRKSILQMSIQGKLVEQRPEEGTAEELYHQIQAEKRQLIKAGKIKKEKPLPEISEDEMPFDIPENWVWMRFGELGSYKKGPFGSALTKSMFVPKGNGSVKVYEQKNAIHKNAELGEYYITREYFETKMKGFEVFPGDIIVSCAGTIGETYVMPVNIEQGIINQALMRMKLFKPIYIPYFLVFFDFVLKKDARSSSKGSAIKNIPPFEILKNYLVPLPPLNEQKRIVDKLEELLSLCEQINYDCK